jgi:hypothetical protein
MHLYTKELNLPSSLLPGMKLHTTCSELNEPF